MDAVHQMKGGAVPPGVTHSGSTNATIWRAGLFRRVDQRRFISDN